jgi:hypothetical protein
MRIFFLLLLIGNIGFAVFQFLMPYEQLFGESRKVPAAEELQLLSEANSEVVKQAEVVAAVEPPQAVEATHAAPAARFEDREPEPLVTEDVNDKRVCYTIGPVKDKARAIEISGRYSGKQITTSLKSSLEKQYMGMMVYIGGHRTREEALKTANRLSAKGVRDHIIVNEPDQPNLLSLGVFGLKKNADRLKNRVQKLGFAADTEPRYRERTIFWIYAQQSSEEELEQLLKQAELEDGISQIPTQCLPS